MSAHRVDVLLGQSALNVLCDSQFLAAWRRLHARCRHATVFQSPAFVCTWYEAYQSKWQPVVARLAAGEGELAGLWLLAFDPDRHELVHAGAHQAEYHVWLASPEAEATFLDSAWAQLRHHLSFKMLRFRYLPATALLGILKTVPGMENRIAVRIQSRPVAKLDPGEIKASFAKKGNKSRFNRLMKLGVLEFRRLVDPTEFDRVFEELIAWYDLRQGAINHTSPFREDPLKRGFYGALFAAAPDETLLTVTFLNGRAIAAFLGAISGKTVHLGMLAYSPFFAEHSPGKLHIMQLRDYVLKEGMETLDLTPGGDPWKERFANAHDEVADVLLHRSAYARSRADILERLLKWSKRCAAKLGIEPSDIRWMIRALKRTRPPDMLRKIKNLGYTQREFRIYRGNRLFAQPFVRDVRVVSNSLADLLCFDPGEKWQRRDVFLSSALARLERGEWVYTVCIRGRLAHYGWMVRNQKESFMTEVQQSLSLPPGSVALYDYYTHPDFRGHGLYRATISHMLCEAFADKGTQYAYISVLGYNLPSRHVIETLGFQYQGSFYWRRFFGWESKWADPLFARNKEASDS